MTCSQIETIRTTPILVQTISRSRDYGTWITWHWIWDLDNLHPSWFEVEKELGYITIDLSLRSLTI